MNIMEPDDRCLESDCEFNADPFPTKIEETFGDGRAIGTIEFDSLKKELKVMAVSLALIERGQWADIRQAYRAVFQTGPQVENFGASNEWSRGSGR